MIHRKLLVASALALALNVVVLPSLAAAERAATPNANDIASLVQTNTGYPVKVSVYASGLDNPRGLKFGPDGYLYVAEAAAAVASRPRRCNARRCRTSARTREAARADASPGSIITATATR